MNFFQHQEKAQQRSTLLIALFIFAVAFVILFTAVTLSILFSYINDGTANLSAILTARFWTELRQSRVFYFIACATAAIVLLGSLYKNFQLGGNGIKVALSLKGKYVHAETNNANHRILRNVVTEMAIASGNPVPKVFVLPEKSINAFAAGFNRHQTVIAVTEGALEQLTRDELQGVIAHEFSHINFGDVKINMRLVALVHGLILIGEIGRFMASRDSDSKENPPLKLIALGFLIMALGYIGTAFGTMIKAAVSRQREFLADASAVQFTRNPDGIGGALRKIAAAGRGAEIESGHANLYNHFYFSGLKPRFLSTLFATHPDLEERIKRLGYKGRGGSIQNNNDQAHTTVTEVKPDAPASDSPLGFASSATKSTAAASTASSSILTAEIIIASVGQPTAQNITNAKQHIESLPSLLVDAATNAFSAQALIFGLIIKQTEAALQSQQWQHLTSHMPNAVHETQRLQKAITALSASQTFNLLLMADPAIQDQSAEQAAQFKHCAQLLINADAKLTLFEWSIYRLAIAPLQTKKAARPSLNRLTECKDAISIVLYYTLSHSQDNKRRAILLGAQNILGFAAPTPKSVSIKQLDSAISQLRNLKTLAKPTLLKALIHCIKGDGIITDEEFTLIRVTALLLDCPIPDIAE